MGGDRGEGPAGMAEGQELMAGSFLGWGRSDQHSPGGGRARHTPPGHLLGGASSSQTPTASRRETEAQIYAEPGAQGLWLSSASAQGQDDTQSACLEAFLEEGAWLCLLGKEQGDRVPGRGSVLEKACAPHRKYPQPLQDALVPRLVWVAGLNELWGPMAQKSPGVSEPSVMEEMGSRLLQLHPASD